MKHLSLTLIGPPANSKGGPTSVQRAEECEVGVCDLQ